jgi:hypothetical protein
MTVHSRVIKTFLAWSPDATDVPLMNGLRVQILPTVYDLPRARKHQFAAFLASDALLVVWDDDPSHLMERAEAIESELMELVWQAGAPQEAGEANDEKKGPRITEFEVDKESGEIIPEERPTNLINTILVAFTLVIIMTLLGLGFRSVAVEVAVDKCYIRLAFLALTPVQVFFTLVVVPAHFRIGRCTDSIPVLLSSHRWLHCSMYWPCSTDARELEILLRQMFASIAEQDASSHYGTMSCIQGRPNFCYRTYCQINQASDLNLRAPRWFGKYVRQR